MNKQPEKTAMTRAGIIDAFWTVAEKRGLKNATVSEIAKTARLNRGTFYVYFSDIDDLLYQAEQEIIDDFQTRLITVLRQTGPVDFRCITAKVVEILGQHDAKLFLLIGEDVDPQFVYKARKAAMAVFQTLLKADIANPYWEYVVAFETSAFTGLLQFWHEAGKRITISELAGLAHTLALKGMIGLQE